MDSNLSCISNKFKNCIQNSVKKTALEVYRERGKVYKDVLFKTLKGELQTLSGEMPKLMYYSGISLTPSGYGRSNIDLSIEDLHSANCSNLPKHASATGHGLKINFKVEVVKEKEVSLKNTSKITGDLLTESRFKKNMPPQLANTLPFGKMGINTWRYGCPKIGKNVLSKLERKIAVEKISYKPFIEIEKSSLKNYSPLNAHEVAKSFKSHVLVIPYGFLLEGGYKSTSPIELDSISLIVTDSSPDFASTFFQIKGSCCIFHTSNLDIVNIQNYGIFH